MVSLAYLEGGNTVIKNRAEKARIYREYVEANAAAGIDSDPAELDRVRMSMAGGDPFGASMIPAGDALKQLADQANSRATNARMQTQTDRWAMQDKERTFVQRIVDDNNWDKSPEDMSKIFEGAFGDQAPQIYDRYKPELPSMLSESTAKKYATFQSDPRSKLIFNDDDIQRFYTAEARSPQTLSVLKSIAKDNARARNKQDFQTNLEVLKQTPDFAVGTPEGRAWWTEQAAQGMGYDSSAQLPQSFKTGQDLAFTQAQAAQQSKVTQLAAKDPYFASAAQNGDEDAIFAATTSLMVQAGMPAPKDKNDPAYLATKKSLELISRTAAVNEYNKKEADLKVAAIQEAEEMTKNKKSMMDAAAQAAFLGDEFGNGKSGKDAAADERIGATLSLINNDPSFFGTPENIQAAVNFVKQKFLQGKDKFDPAAIYAEFMSSGPAESKASWIQRRTNTQIEGNGLLKPGSNFRAQMEQRKSQVTEVVNTAFTALNKPANTQAEYDRMMNSKAVIVQRLRAELNNIRTSVNTLNNDPAVRSNVTGYDYQASLRDMEVLENSIQTIEKFNPVPPDIQKSLDESKAKLDNAQRTLDNVHKNMPVERDFWGRPVPQKTTTVVTPMSYESYYEDTGSGYQPVAYTNAPRTRMDTYLDAVADAESNGDPFARANTSSAKGLFQFTKGTWGNLVDRYGEKLGIAKDDIYNPHAQRAMAQILTIQNANQLYRQTGKEPNEGDLYLAHFLGPSRAATVINHQGSSLLAANLFPDAAQANRGIFYKDGVPVTVEQLYKTMSSKLKRRIKSTAVDI